MDLTILNWCLLLYALPALLSYVLARLYFTYTRISHHKPHLGTVLFVLLPFANIVAVLWYTIDCISYVELSKNEAIGKRFLRLKDKK